MAAARIPKPMTAAEYEDARSVSTVEAARVIGCCRRTVNNMCKRGDIPNYRTGDTYRIRVVDLLRFVGAR